MTMIRTIIVDDEPIIRADIEDMLKVFPDIEIVGTCGTVDDAIAMITELKPDLLMLDVQLGSGNSFQIIKALPDLSCSIIFATAFDNHAINAIRIGALDYLLKPFDEEELASAIAKVRQKNPPATSEQVKLASGKMNGTDTTEAVTSIALRSKQQVHIAAFADIIYCEGDGNYTTFYLTMGKKLLVSRPLKEYEELLPQQQFIRSHQSFLVNMRYIEYYDREGMLYLQNKKQIPVSTRRKDAVLGALKNLK
jgi:two-component system, LytTR family, response regulator